MEPILYEAVDLYSQPMAELFINSLQPRPSFASTTVKAVSLRQSVTPEQGAKILQLCQGLRELALQIAADLPDDQNPLREPLKTLQLSMLSLDLASAFYGPMIFLPDLPLFKRIKRLHLTNAWVARHGLHIGLPYLPQLTHVSFPIQPSGHGNIHTDILAFILQVFRGLRLVILWRMPYHGSHSIYECLSQCGILDRRVVVFNCARFTHCAQSDGSIWTLGERVVQLREDRGYGIAFSPFI